MPMLMPMPSFQIYHVGVSKWPVLITFFIKPLIKLFIKRL